MQSNNDSGIYLSWFSNNTLQENNISNNNAGVYFSSDSNNNNLTENLICSHTGTDIYDLGGNCGTAQDDNNTCDDENNWDDYGTTGCTYVCGFVSGAAVRSTNATGGCYVDCYCLGETICAEGFGFDSNKNVRIYIVKDKNQWQDGDILNDFRGAYNTTTADAFGNFGQIHIWGSIPGGYDIVVDQDGDGYYNDTRDAIDSATDEGFYVTPEPSALALFITGLSLIYGLARVKRKS